MEKIIFFGLVIPILIFVIYLGGRAIMTGYNAKISNKSNEEEETEDQIETSLHSKDSLSSELNRVNELLKSGALTQEEFEKAKKKILED